MARGFFSGMITGTAVSVLAVGTASVMTDIPGQAAPEATALEVPAGSAFDQPRDDTQAKLPDGQETTTAPETPRVEAPAPDDLSSIGEEATASAAQPETGAAQGALNAPETVETAGVAVDSDSPVLPSPQAAAPEAPGDEDDLSISTEPAQPLQPKVAEEQTAFLDPAEEPDPSDLTTTPQTAAGETGSDHDTQSAPDDGMAQAQAQPAPASDSAAQEPAVESDAVSDSPSDAAQASSEEDTGAGTQPELMAEEITQPQAPDPVPQDSNLTDLDSDPAPGAEDTAPKDNASSDATAESGQEVAVLAQPEPSGTIDDLAKNVTTDRLPSVTAEPDAAQPETEADLSDAAAGASDDESLPAIQRHAATFENPEDKPLMSIVLIDDGSSPIGLDALKTFPYPLSFAVDTGWSGAPRAMQTYRDAGFEVLAMIDLPAEASAVDTEVAMQDYLGKVPQAVAVMEGEGTGLQSTREASAQLAQILKASGHGVVMFPDGLNTAQKLISREGVPAASVFRDFDAKGQGATVIRRFLDQAAFRAGQENDGVIMVGRLRADTISALLLWGLQDRANRVALAPVSALLQNQ